MSAKDTSTRSRPQFCHYHRLATRFRGGHHAGRDTASHARAVGADRKSKISMLLYAAAIPLAFYNQWISGGIYVAVALSWLVPDRRIERTLTTTTT